ncbi:DUF2243 domain-containing protein [Microbacterium sp. 179-I 3D4 NHS]|uniref:DUF2243 domain-containing protein n=1 Tax=Microbacterium sp. 179-I 3D4 NHS TaxID=3142381 RepID=UPI0039A0D228
MRRMLRTRAFLAGILLGVAVMAAIDEIVFHQILGWHHFYDRSTPDIALLSDGLLHAGELFVAVAGVFLLLDARRREGFRAGAVGCGLLIGAGAFQLFDGLVDHKVLQVHQIRYGVELLPYDLAWNAAGAVLLVAGIVATAAVGRREDNARTSSRA